MNPWIFLIVAGIVEVAWALTLKYSEMYTKPVFAAANLICLFLSLYLLTLALKEIPIGTAYACWTAIGAVGVVIVGILFLNEPKSLVRIAFISIIIFGIVGLKLTSP